MRRRVFLLASGAVAAACGRRRPSAWRYFTAAEARTVDAICGLLIPADRDPGAREARVVNYIDLQLTQPFRKYQRVYRQGVAGIDAASLRMFGKRFVDLSTEKQTPVLKDAEKNSKAFFELILAHTRQGFYGDPRHGGNYQLASWKMLRLPYPPIRGRQHYV